MDLADASRHLLRPLTPPVPARQVSLITHGEGLKTRLLERLKQSIIDGVPRHLKEKRADWQIVNPH
jgi:hypothetical protein